MLSGIYRRKFVIKSAYGRKFSSTSLFENEMALEIAYESEK
jgi:hypothetical protein